MNTIAQLATNGSSADTMRRSLSACRWSGAIDMRKGMNDCRAHRWNKLHHTAPSLPQGGRRVVQFASTQPEET